MSGIVWMQFKSELRHNIIYMQYPNVNLSINLNFS